MLARSFAVDYNQKIDVHINAVRGALPYTEGRADSRKLSRH